MFHKQKTRIIELPLLCMAEILGYLDVTSYVNFMLSCKFGADSGKDVYARALRVVRRAGVDAACWWAANEQISTGDEHVYSLVVSIGKSEMPDSFDFRKRLATIHRELAVLERVISEYPDDDKQLEWLHNIERQIYLVKRDREHHTLSTGLQLICASMRNDLATMRRLLANPNAGDYVNAAVLIEGKTMRFIGNDLGACPSDVIAEMFREKKIRPESLWG